MVRLAITAITALLLALVVSATPVHAALILNEALANEPGSTTSLEWVEILNWPDTGEAISLSGYKFIDGGVTTTIDTALSIPAGGFAILARKATGTTSFEERWGNASGVWGDHESESYPLITISQISLRNSSDTLRLVSPSGDTSTILWTSDAGDGTSIERVRPGANDALSNFEACEDSLGSTPGSQNSVLPARGDLAIDTVVVGPALPVASEPVQFAVNIRNVGFGDVEQSGVALARIPHPSSTTSYVQHIMAWGFGPVGEGSEVSKVLAWPDPRPGVNYMRLSLSSDGDTTNNHYNLPITVRFDQPYLIISEYLANPEIGGPEEWVEIANMTGHSINVEGIRLGDSLNYEVLPYSEIEIAAYNFLVLVENETAFRAQYPAFEGALIAVSGWRALNNSGDGIRLIGPMGEIIDSLTFRTTYPGNRSIERVELSATYAPPGDWAASEDDLGATPGKPNSVQRGNPGSLILDSVWLAPSSPQWGDTIRILAAVTNNSFGPAAGWSIVVSRDLDFSSPGASLDKIASVSIPATSENESTTAELLWVNAPPGIHRLHIALKDESNETIATSAIVTTVRFSQPLVIISEYMAAPTPGGPGEWIELYNASEIPISFMGIRIGDSASFGAIPLPIPELEPGAFLVAAQDEEQFRSFYSQFGGQVRSLGNWPTLNDAGDMIRLIGPADEIIDSLSFRNLTAQNRSIERRQLIAEFADPRDWGESIDVWGGTPGDANSIRRYAIDVSVDSVVLEASSVSWPGPVCGDVYVSNTGFNDVSGLFVSILHPGHGEITRLNLPSTLVSGHSSMIPFEFDAPRIGYSSFSFLVTEDDFINNNYAIADLVVASTFPVVIVSEYLADPIEPGPGEWLELYNASQLEIALAGFDLGDSSGFSAIQFTLVDRLYPDSFVVLCANRDRFRSWYPSFDGRLVQVHSWRELNNTGDKIRLQGAAGEIVDSLTFFDVHGDNTSSERLTTAPTFSQASDWAASVDPSGATPGRPNSVNSATAGPLRVDVTPNPVFRSAGQTARIDYQLEIGESLTLRIYDRAGRIVRTIADEMPSATGFVEWNGTDDDGHELMPGPYVLLARSEPTGSMKKMVVVIAP